MLYKMTSHQSEILHSLIFGAFGQHRGRSGGVNKFEQVFYDDLPLDVSSMGGGWL